MFSAVNVITLNQLCDILGILAFVEAGLEDGLVLEVAEAEQLQGAELAVVAQAELSDKTAIPSSSNQTN